MNDLLKNAKWPDTGLDNRVHRLTRTFNDRYELFKACKEENMRIYEGVSK